MKSFLSYLQEAVKAPKKIRGGDAYETVVMNVLSQLETTHPSFKIDHSTAGGGSDSHGSGDIMLILNGGRHPLEIKMDSTAQMGGTSVRYERDTFNDMDDPMDAFEFVDSHITPEDRLLFSDALAKSRKIVSLNMWLDHVSSVAPKSINDVDSIPTVVTEAAWDSAQKSGLLKQINSVVQKDSAFICDHYQQKNPPVNYIQIGKSGLFHTGRNPLGISSIPKLEGKIEIEIRLGPSGTKMQGGVATVSAALRMQGRLKFSAKSPHTLDTIDGATKLLDAILKSQRSIV